MRDHKLAISSYLDKLKSELYELGQQLFNTPELGFKEHQTKQIMLNKIKQLGNVEIKDNLAITGFSAEIKAKKASQTIALIAEMDAVYQPLHFCAAVDGAAHCCGHDSQMVIMYAVLKTIHDLKIDLPVNLRLIFTPAEEFLDLDYRQQLQKDGKIKFLSGKQELLANGDFDDVDLAISCHSLGGDTSIDFDLGADLVGFIIKKAKFIGKSSHAGAAPHLGINAFNAASLAMNAIAFARETFPNDDYIRVSPVLKNNSWAANVVPEVAELEMYVRAANVDAIIATSQKIDNCLNGAALAVGAKVEIDNIMGYLPLTQSQELIELAQQNAQTLTNSSRIQHVQRMVAASGDIGDISLFMPTVQIGYGGYVGTIHGVDFAISQAENIYLRTSKLIAGMLLDLCADNAQVMNAITQQFNGITTAKYVNLIEKLSHG